MVKTDREGCPRSDGVEGRRRGELDRVPSDDGTGRVHPQFRLAAIGVVIGVAGALFATRLIQSWLFEVGPADPMTFVAVAAGLVVVSLIASYIPARRATKVDPLLAMRAD